jgi:hypothetical protein
LEGDLIGKAKAVTPQDVSQAIQEAQAGELMKKYREAETNYRELAKQQPPNDWSADAEKWNRILSDFLSPGTGEDFAKRWDKHIQADPGHLSLYELLYLEQIRVRKPRFVDREILKKFHTAEKLNSAEKLTRLVLVMAAWDALQFRREDSYRQSLWEDLIKLIRNKNGRLRDRETQIILAGVFPEFWQGLPKWDQTEFVNLLLVYQDRGTVRFLANLAGVDEVTVRRWFLTKTVEVEFIKTPFKDGLEYMQDVSPVTVWLDPVVANDEREITLTMAGRWLDALDQILAKTPYESALLEDGIVWVGPSRHARRWIAVTGSWWRSASRIRDSGKVGTWNSSIRRFLTLWSS